jgi:hypothetical protein
MIGQLSGACGMMVGLLPRRADAWAPYLRQVHKGRLRASRFSARAVAITTCRPSRRTAGVPNEPRPSHRSEAEARGDTTGVGTIRRVAAI